MGSREPSPDVVGTLLAFGTVLWRLGASPIALWRDWMFVAAAYWIAITVIASPAVKRILTPLAMLYLLVLFAQGNVPAVWRSYGWWQ